MNVSCLEAINYSLNCLKAKCGVAQWYRIAVVCKTTSLFHLTLNEPDLFHIHTADIYIYIYLPVDLHPHWFWSRSWFWRLHDLLNELAAHFVTGHEDVGPVPRNPPLQTQKVKHGQVTALWTQTGLCLVGFLCKTTVPHYKVFKLHKNAILWMLKCQQRCLTIRIYLRKCNDYRKLEI